MLKGFPVTISLLRLGISSVQYLKLFWLSIKLKLIFNSSRAIKFYWSLSSISLCIDDNLFLLKFNTLKFGIVLKLKNIWLGFTSTLVLLKLFELKFSSTRLLKKERLLGSVHKSFEAISRTSSLRKLLNSYKCEGGILL